MIWILAALSIFVTPEGEHKWRYVTMERNPALHMEQLSREMGYERICPKGWKVENKQETRIGRTVYVTYEGKCR